MKKRYLIGGMAGIIFCAIVLCAFAFDENTGAPETVVSEQQIPAAVLDGYAIARDRVSGSKDGILN